jgi:hypothetical protein
MSKKVECDVCGKKVFSSKANGIFRHSGMKYFCHRKKCQEIFVESAGEMPDDDADYYFGG